MATTLVSAGDFIEALRTSQLLDDSQRASFDQLTRQMRDLKPLVHEVVRRGWLTTYQATQVAKGKIAELVLDQYVILELLGQGGMGAVYKARQRRMDRFVALKVIRSEVLRTPGAVERFQREGQTAAKLSHPNIVTVFDSNTVNGSTPARPWRRVEGAIKKDGSFTWVGAPGEAKPDSPHAGKMIGDKMVFEITPSGDGVEGRGSFALVKPTDPKKDPVVDKPDPLVKGSIWKGTSQQLKPPGKAPGNWQFVVTERTGDNFKADMYWLDSSTEKPLRFIEGTLKKDGNISWKGSPGQDRPGFNHEGKFDGSKITVAWVGPQNGVNTEGTMVLMRVGGPEVVVKKDPDPKMDPKKDPPKKDPPTEMDANLVKALKALRSTKAADRLEAIDAIAKMGADAADGFRPLCELICVEKSPKVAQAATDALDKINSNLAALVVTIAVDKDDRKRSAAVTQIGNMKEDGRPAYPIVLTDEVRAASEKFPQGARVLVSLEALVNTDPESPETMRALNGSLQLNYAQGLFVERPKWRIVTLIGQLATADDKARKAAVPSLLTLARSEHDKKKGAIDPDKEAKLEAMKLLVAFSAEDDKVKKSVVTVLVGWLKLDDKMPGLGGTVVTRKDEKDLKLEAMRHLGAFGAEDAKAAIPTLKQLKLDSDADIRKAAKDVLDGFEAK